MKSAVWMCLPYAEGSQEARLWESGGEEGQGAKGSWRDLAHLCKHSKLFSDRNVESLEGSKQRSDII